jgi:hypothetical protein
MRKKNHGIDVPCDGQEYLAALQSRDPEAVEHFESHFGPLIRLKLRSQYPKHYEDGLMREVLWNVLVKVDNGFPEEGRSLPALVVEVCHETARRRMSALRAASSQVHMEPLLLDLLFAS